MNKEMSYIIFYGHKVWAVPSNSIPLIRKMTIAAIRSHIEGREKKGIDGQD